MRDFFNPKNLTDGTSPMSGIVAPSIRIKIVKLTFTKSTLVKRLFASPSFNCSSVTSSRPGIA